MGHSVCDPFVTPLVTHPGATGDPSLVSSARLVCLCPGPSPASADRPWDAALGRLRRGPLLSPLLSTAEQRGPAEEHPADHREDLADGADSFDLPQHRLCPAPDEGDDSSATLMLGR
jgi:hypothetical protein